MFSRALLVAAAVAAVPAVAVAGGDRAGRAECRAARDARHLPVYDANRDGVLDHSERRALRQARRQEALARYDVDRDGQLGETERAKLHRDKLGEKFARLDRNRDGAISRDEASGPCSHVARRFDAIDQDRDGRITLAELSAVKMFGRHGRGKGRFHRPPPGAEPDVEAEPEL